MTWSASDRPASIPTQCHPLTRDVATVSLAPRADRTPPPTRCSEDHWQGTTLSKPRPQGSRRPRGSSVPRVLHFLGLPLEPPLRRAPCPDTPNLLGDCQAHCALRHVVITRLATDPQTRAYMEGRVKEGRSKYEVLRAIKRIVAREVYRTLHRGHEQRAPGPGSTLRGTGLTSHAQRVDRERSGKSRSPGRGRHGILRRRVLIVRSR